MGGKIGTARLETKVRELKAESVGAFHNHTLMGACVLTFTTRQKRRVNR
jgi:hypothetical protein